MLRGFAIIAVALLALAPAGCQKKNPAKGDAPTGAMDPAAPRDVPGSRATAVGAMSAPAKSAAALCAEGLRPDHPVTKEQYELTVKVPAEGAVGATAQADILVTPKAGYKVNLKYPTELTVKTSSPGISLPQPKLEKAQAMVLSVKQLHFQVPFVLKSAGRKVVQGELGFSVCTPKLCITEPDLCVAWEVTAK